MIDGLEPYPAMKNSGVEWLGEVPAHWDVRRLRNVAAMCVSNVDKHVKGEEIPVRLCNYVDVYKNDHISQRLDFMQATAAPEEIERFRLDEGDVLITKDSEAWDDIGVPALVTCAADDLISGYHLALLRPFAGQMSGGYLLRALQSKRVAHQFHVEAKGVTRYGLSHTGIKSVWLPLPSLPEQAAIARFLDIANRRIERYIRAKDELIALLEEHKRAIIHEAVTGRIDVRTGQPYPSYKSSGVGWLQDVPEHWERVRLKTLLKPVDRRSITGAETLLSLRRDHGVVVYEDHFAHPPQGTTLVGFKHVRAGELVVNRLQANNGLVFCSRLNGLVSPDYSVFETTRVHQTQYLSDLLRTEEYRAQFRREARGLGTGTAGFLRLYDDAFLRTVVHLPPLAEQRAILRFLDTAEQKLNALTAKAQRELDLTKEFRAGLVADVVTGKLDVREAVTALPEELDHSEAVEGDRAESKEVDDGRPECDRRTGVPTIQEETTE